MGEWTGTPAMYLRTMDGPTDRGPLLGVMHLDGFELLIGGGWDRDYGRVARARLTEIVADGPGRVAASESGGRIRPR